MSQEFYETVMKKELWDSEMQDFYQDVWLKLSYVDVSNFIEKKGNLSYLPWAWAWGVLMAHYPQSSYSFDEPKRFDDGTVEIWCTLTIRKDGCEANRSMWLPVMDHRNKAIINPDARAINDARMRCLTKCLAMFGLGHFIYAGEELPPVKAEYIDKEQAIQIAGLIEATQTDLKQFLNWLKVSALEEIEQNQYARAYNALSAKLEKQINDEVKNDNAA